MTLVSEVMDDVLAAFDVSRADVLGPSRLRQIVRARQAGFHLSRKYTKASLPQIGRQFNRDHTTVMHGLNAVKLWTKEEPEYADMLNQADEAVRGRVGAIFLRKETSPLVFRTTRKSQ